MDTQRAIIWDMDGVLVDSHAVHFEAWRQIVRQELGFELDRCGDSGRTGLRVAFA